MVPQQKASTKDKHWTLIGLTALNGDPIMCVLILAGIRKVPIYKCVMDVFAEQVGEVTDEHYFKQNCGKSKKYPGGPTCVFQGVEVPCLVQWSPKGSITSQILVDILATLDHLRVFNFFPEGSHSSCLMVTAAASSYHF